MANIDWRITFPNALVEVLIPHNSDHNPLILYFHKFDALKALSLHFQAALISHPEYENILSQAQGNTNGDSIATLKKVLEESIVFQQAFFGNIFK